MKKILIMLLLVPALVAAEVRVYGFIRDARGVVAKGVKVMAVRSGGVVAIDTTGDTTVIVVDIESHGAESDSLGYFAMDLKPTSSFADSNSGLYDIWASRNAFRITGLHIDGDLDSLNIGDSLAGR